jgi:translocation and assembly module TamA
LLASTQAQAMVDGSEGLEGNNEKKATKQPATLPKCGARIDLEASLDDETCKALEGFARSLARKPSKKIHIERQRAKSDSGKLQAFLVSEGYYAAEVSPKVTAAKALVTSFSVRPGVQFKIRSTTITYLGTDVSDLPANLEAFKLEGGISARSVDILSLQQQILTILRNTGHPQAELSGQNLLANFETNQADLVYEIAPGPPCTYGELEITGLSRVDLDLVKNTVSLRRGKRCSREEFDTQRLALTKTGLFAAVEIKPHFASHTGEITPIAINLKEAKARTVGAGFSYSTQTGVGGRIYWEHRNLLGKGERLHAEIKVEEIQQEGKVSLRKPYPGRDALVFAELAAATQAKDAYDADLYRASIGAAYPLWGPWRLSNALEYEYANIEELGIREAGHSVMVPIVLSQSTVDDPLDPEDGINLSLIAAPAYSTFGDNTAFVKLDGRVAHHLPLGSSSILNLSTWMHAGALMGGSVSNIPATLLYYGGGTKSVRAIAWEHLGDVASDGTPLGGRSILDGGIELRANLKTNWQVVGFVEGGRVFAASTPNFDEDILWGVGLGLRYRTPIGPLRFDIASPLNPRPEDADIQIYVGLGQAF